MNKIIKMTIFSLLTLVFFNKSWANEEYDKCVEDMTKEAGEEMDYVYSAIIIQYCTNEFKKSEDNEN